MERDKYSVRNLALADDDQPANGETILDYAQALTKARASLARPVGPFTVKQAVDAYLKAKQADGRDVVDARCRADAHILPSLGHVECAKLTKDKIQDWHRSLAKALPRTRTKPGKAQQFRKFTGDRDAVRRRQASANRVMTILKAALNTAFENGKIASDTAWRRVKRFKGVEEARLRYLDLAEAKRLINTADPDFRKLVQGALQSGARYGQLAELVARISMLTLKAMAHCN